MSDSASSADATSESQSELFSPAEIEQFGVDDVTAGGAIGKMLSALFLYTVFAMGIAGWWTYSSISDQRADAESKVSGHGHEGDHSHAADPH
jgi:hypothetical protein